MDLLEKLEAINAARGPDFVREFEEVLADVAGRSDPRFIVPLMKYFEDRPPYEELMFSIIHTIEAFDDGAYVRELLQGLPTLRQRSPRWSAILLVRTLNSDSARLALGSQLRSTRPEVQSAVVSMLEEISSRSPKFASKAEEVRRAVVSSPD